jgi:hypothetical protein
MSGGCKVGRAWELPLEEIFERVSCSNRASWQRVEL